MGSAPTGGSALYRAVALQLLPLQQTRAGWECERGIEGQRPGVQESQEQGGGWEGSREPAL